VLGEGANRFSDMSVRTGGSQYNAQKGKLRASARILPWTRAQFAGPPVSNRLVIRKVVSIHAYNGIVINTPTSG